MKAVTFFMVILTATLAEACASARQRPRAAIVIRTYNYAAVSAERLAAARSEAEQIFTRAGISLEWIDCRVPGGDGGAACTEPLLAGRDMMLRLVDRAPVTGDRIVALGESMIDREQRGGVLMTVDLFPVRAVAGRSVDVTGRRCWAVRLRTRLVTCCSAARRTATGFDARPVVARRAARSQARALGILGTRGGANARDGVRKLSRTADSRALYSGL